MSVVRRLHEGIYQLKLPCVGLIEHIYVYLILLEVPTLIDVGINTEESRAALVQQLGSLGLTLQDIKQVIITHHHADHIGGLAFLNKDVQIFGHPRLKYLASNDPFVQQHFRSAFISLGEEFGVPGTLDHTRLRLLDNKVYGFPIERFTAVSEGDVIPNTNGLMIVETPGHSTAHISCLYPNLQICFTGDMIFSKQSLSIWLEPKVPFEEERPTFLGEYVQSLNKIKGLNLNCLYPSHGEVILNIEEEIESKIKQLEKKSIRVLNQITDQAATIWEIYEKVYSPAFINKFFTLTFPEFIGIVDVLYQNGDIKRDQNKLPFQIYRKKEI